MTWLQKIAQTAHFDNTTTVLSNYIRQLPGDWTLANASRLDENEMNIGYRGRNVKKKDDEYIIIVWFIFDPSKTPKTYNTEVGHHSFEFRVQVLKTTEADRINLTPVGKSSPSLDAAKDVSDFAWEQIYNDGWEGDQIDEGPTTPTPTNYQPEPVLV